MTPFFLLISVPSYPKPLPPSVPADNAPGPGWTPCALPSPLHTLHTHARVHTRAHTRTHSPSPVASGICCPSGICVRQTGWAGLQPQRPRAPGHPRSAQVAWETISGHLRRSGALALFVAKHHEETNPSVKGHHGFSWRPGGISRPQERLACLCCPFTQLHRHWSGEHPLGWHRCWGHWCGRVGTWAQEKGERPRGADLVSVPRSPQSKGICWPHYRRLL